MTLVETLQRIKDRLTDQQARTGETLLMQRSEMDALWACVEVRAQAVDGREDIEVPDYFGDPKKRLRGGIFRRSR
ncbi:hypothetical protein [Agromyces kandeliae]|uniref:Uncharacterized protein n=1 Tax=Agromyces kandeliae TaxID=2666141 RepID=A0A6L5QYS1_9MICO|nr:hypothetical protein [Agromyces kandeliae]MRX42338.1 hypothetical protein [Agromyces kandeliae]